MKTKRLLLFIVGVLFCLVARAEYVMTTSDYPYNGMGHVILNKHIVEVGGFEKNQLYQDNFKKGPEGARVDNEYTIFVIKYDFELAEDIEIPAGSVLKFEGGSVSGKRTITGNNTGIEAGLVKVFGERGDGYLFHE